MPENREGGTMINAVGEANMQQTIRANYYSQAYQKDMLAEKTNQHRKLRPVEKAEPGSESEMNQQYFDTTTKNNLEDGQLVVEKYDKNGKLIKKTPPGYLPFGDMA
jgi:hypothetical protein